MKNHSRTELSLSLPLSCAYVCACAKLCCTLYACAVCSIVNIFKRNGNFRIVTLDSWLIYMIEI